MKRILLLAAILAPLAALAQNITASKHNLSMTGTGTVKAATETQICIFCHTPHKAQATQLLWNRNATAATTVSWGTTTTTAGTALPTSLMPASLACMTCHDGTVAIGSVRNAGSGVAGVIVVNGGQVGGLMSVGGTVGLVGTTNNDLSGNHPVSIGYPGSGAYNGLANTATGYRAVLAAGCSSPSGICTNGPTYGLMINLKGTAAVAGVECGTCHDPHGTANTFLLRAPVAASNLCLACHIK